MKFIDLEFVDGFIRMADDGWQQGWHERNGGNLSYRLKPEEVEEAAAFTSENDDWKSIEEDMLDFVKRIEATQKHA